MKKQAKDRMFKQMNAKKTLGKVQKAKTASNAPATLGELYAVQNTFNFRTDKALMSVAGIISMLVEKGICTYDEFKEKELEMTRIFSFVREHMTRAHDKSTKPEEISAKVYEEAVAAGIDKDILINIFGVRPSESRIVKPNKNNNIIVP